MNFLVNHSGKIHKKPTIRDVLVNKEAGTLAKRKVYVCEKNLVNMFCVLFNHVDPNYVDNPCR